MKTINKKINPVSIDNGPVVCEITFDGSKLSISGNYPRGGGQISDTLRNSEGLTYNPGWTPDLLTRFLDTWDRWHLNDMRAGCEHQRGWDTGKQLTLVDVRFNSWKIATPRNESDRETKDRVYRHKAIETFINTGHWPVYDIRRDFLTDLIQRVKIAAQHGEVYRPKDEAERSWFDGGVIEIKTEQKRAGHVYPSEHPEGLLTKPCPVCGYAYGSSWLKEEVPEDVIAFLDSLPPFNPAPGPKDRVVVKVDDLTLTIKSRFVDIVQGFPFDKKDTSDHAHFKITLEVDGKQRSFDYYGSANDCSEGKDTLTPADMLQAAQSVIQDATYADQDFHDFCGDLGYDEDSRSAERIYKACEKTAEKLSGLGIEGDMLYSLIDAIESQSVLAEG